MQINLKPGNGRFILQKPENNKTRTGREVKKVSCSFSTRL
jgi:hypothetical protein